MAYTSAEEAKEYLLRLGEDITPKNMKLALIELQKGGDLDPGDAIPGYKYSPQEPIRTVYDFDLSPGEEVVINGTRYYNPTEAIQHYNHTIEIVPVDGVHTLEILWLNRSEINITPAAISVWFLPPIEFTEPFTSIVSLDPGTAETGGTLETDDHEWGILYANNRDEGFSWSADNGLQFTLDRSTFYSARGFLMFVPAISFPFATHSFFTLDVESSLISDFALGENGYWGIWLIGAAPNYPCVWLQLNTELEFSIFPTLTPYGDAEYQYAIVGAGEHSIDVSAFSAALGGRLAGFLIEAYINPFIG